MAGEGIDHHPHRPLLVAAYRQFRAGHPRAALDRLEPVIAGDELANRSSVTYGSLVFGCGFGKPRVTFS